MMGIERSYKCGTVSEESREEAFGRSGNVP
jgi:hypothetical protein